ncbi:unnamed protein product, partial [marine sediment metagenome]
IVLAFGHAIQRPYVILDTGFTGDVQVTPRMARELGLRVRGVTPVLTATGTVSDLPVAVAVVSMEGITKYVNILISNGLPSVGISFLAKFRYRVLLDYRTILLQRI